MAKSNGVIMNINKPGRSIRLIITFYSLSTIMLSAQTFKTLVNFDGVDGAEPAGSLVQGLDGNLYGTTYSGGPFGKNDFGTIFRIPASGGTSGSYDFCPQPQNGCPAGEAPYAGLLLASDGNFYGTTSGIGF